MQTRCCSKGEMQLEAITVECNKNVGMWRIRVARSFTKKFDLNACTITLGFIAFEIIIGLKAFAITFGLNASWHIAAVANVPTRGVTRVQCRERVKSIPRPSTRTKSQRPFSSCKESNKARTQQTIAGKRVSQSGCTVERGTSSSCALLLAGAAVPGGAI